MSWKPQGHSGTSGTRRLFLIPAGEGVFKTDLTRFGDTETGLTLLG